MKFRQTSHFPMRQTIPIRTQSRLAPKINKIIFLTIGASLISAIIIFRLFSLQVLQHDYYDKLASQAQYGFTEIPAQRGEIIIKDYHSGEEFLLATNTTLNLLFADPALIKDATYVGDILTPLIFDMEDERAADNERLKEASKTVTPDFSEEDIQKLLKPLSDDELKEQFKKNLIAKISAKVRPEILLAEDMEEEALNGIKSLNLTGVDVIEKNVYAYPPQIVNLQDAADKLAPYVLIEPVRLKEILKGENRYVVIARKLDPQISEKIEILMKDDPNKTFSGIGMKEESFRYYPEGSLAANVVGYVNRENVGQYGIESTFNTELNGVAGKFQTKRDSVGRQITVGESILTKAIDGDDLVLTLDRSVQLKLDQVMEEAVKKYNADNGQAIIMDPKTGAVIAMSHYPSFNPNNYGDVFEKEEISFTTDEMKNLIESPDKGIYYYYYNPITLDRYFIFEKKDENGNSRYYRYKNLFGAEVYHNKIVAWPYEPGSVFKSVVMSIALDDGDVTPNTVYNDVGPVGVDFNVYTGEYDYEIKNSTGYHGLVNMQTVISKSLNTGMTFVSKKIGPALFYSYLKKFGLLDRTDIEFDSEITGTLEYYEDWTESELATKAFGQGISMTMIQLANSYNVLANGGILMQPHIIEEVRQDDGTITETEQREIRRVIDEETSAQITKMLIFSVEDGEARQAKSETHFLAGKTGTSQTYKWGQALSGNGTTIASFAGYGPVDDPQFVIIIKFDRPRASEWGSSTAAPTFKILAEYLFDYYNIPPDK